MSHRDRDLSARTAFRQCLTCHFSRFAPRLSSLSLFARCPCFCLCLFADVLHLRSLFQAPAVRGAASAGPADAASARARALRLHFYRRLGVRRFYPFGRHPVGRAGTEVFLYYGPSTVAAAAALRAKALGLPGVVGGTSSSSFSSSSSSACSPGGGGGGGVGGGGDDGGGGVTSHRKRRSAEMASTMVSSLIVAPPPAPPTAAPSRKRERHIKEEEEEDDEVEQKVDAEERPLQYPYPCHHRHQHHQHHHQHHQLFFRDDGGILPSSFDFDDAVSNDAALVASNTVCDDDDCSSSESFTSDVDVDEDDQLFGDYDLSAFYPSMHIASNSKSSGSSVSAHKQQQQQQQQQQPGTIPQQMLETMFLSQLESFLSALDSAASSAPMAAASAVTSTRPSVTEEPLFWR